MSLVRRIDDEVIELARVLRESTNNDGPRFPLSDARYELESGDVGRLSVHGDLAVEDDPSGVGRQSLRVCDARFGLDA